MEEPRKEPLKPEISDIPYKALVLHAPHGIFVTDKHGNFIFVNQAASLATGYDQEDLRSMNLVDLIHPDDRECALRHLSEVENTGTAVGEMRYITKSGNTRYCEFKAVHISDECLLAFTSDITQKQHALDDSARKAEELKAAFEELSSTEEELKQQLEEIQAAQNEIEERERKYRLLFNTSEAGVALHEIICDDTGTAVDYRFLEVNAAFERLTGLAGKEIIGKTVREVLVGVEPYWMEMYGRVALTGKPIHFENYSRELGKYYEVTAYSPTKGQFVTIFYDISDRKRQEIQLEETNSLLESLITAANVPILVWDRSCTIIRLNHACEELIGRPADEMVGRHLNVLFPPWAYERSMRLIQTTLAGVRWEEAEIPILHRSGAVKDVIWNSATIYDQEGNPRATIAQGRDITAERELIYEKKKAAAQIQENIAKLAILNDGIRNPLSIIAAYTDLIDDPATARIIEREIIRIDEMVSTLDQEWIKSEKILNFLKKHEFEKAGFYLGHEHGMEHNAIQPEQDGAASPKSQYELFIEELQAQLYTILDSIDALIYVADMKTYEIVYLNKQSRYQVGNIVGQTCYTNFQSQSSPCDFCTNRFLVDENGPTGVYRWEHYNPKTGRWYDCRDRAIRWTDGRLVRLEIATDITEKKRMEKALRESETRFYDLFDNLPVAVAIYQAVDDGNDFVFLHFNRAGERIEQVSKTEIVGRSVCEIFPGVKDFGLFEVFQRVYQTGNPEHHPISFYTDGRITGWRENYVYKLPSGEIVAIYADVTEQKEMERHLHETTQKLLLLTQINRHDIFNELTAMFLSLDLAFDSDDLLEIFPILRTLKEGLRRIEQVLQFTREYDTFADAHSTWLNLHAIIESLKNEVDFGSISFEDTVPENLEIFADLLIVKAFRSIFDNAIRHGKTLTQVYFSVQEQEGDLLIVCADDGIGIPREEKEAIFSYGHGKNTGIGLFLAREILKLNGCTIQEAGVETKGSRFEIRVPEKRWRIQERDIRN